MKWPLNIACPNETAISGSAFGQHITLTRTGDSLTLNIDEDSWMVGLPVGANAVALGPALGTLPFLVYVRPRVIVPAGGEVSLALSVPLHLELATDAVRLFTIEPVQSRALYGPVDGGTLCWSVHSNADVSTELRIAGHAAKVSAVAKITCCNDSADPVEVTRIMVPTDMVGLYSVGDGLQLSEMTMTILGEAEAELTMEPATGGKPLADVLGRPIVPVRRSFAFSHTYRNRTGLEYGF